MDEKLYQNIDLPQINPLDVSEEIPQNSVKKPLNPKILFLIILAAIIFVLLLLSLIVTQIRQRNSSPAIPTPTSSPPLPIPTINDSLIPSPYQNSFKLLEQSFSQDPDLPVPQIDTKIGQ